MLRLILHAAFLPYLVVSIFDVRNPEAIIVSSVILALLVVGFRPLRGKALEVVTRLTTIRLFDLLLWNLFLTFFFMEVVLAVGDWVTGHPLLMEPNARSQERIEHYKRSLEGRSGSDPRNSQGFNDSEWVVPKPVNTVRVAALGDSFAFGIVGYEKNFLTLLESELAGRVGTSIEVANLGIPALDPIDYLEILNSEARSLEPDLTLVCLFSGNDFVETSRGSLLRLRNTRTFSFLWRLYRSETEHLRRNNARLHIDAHPGAIAKPPTLSSESYLELAEGYLALLEKNYTRKTQKGVQDTLAVLEEIAATTGPDRLLIAVLPNEVQVNSALRGQVCERKGVSEQELDLSKPARLVYEHFAGKGVTVVDLLPAFVEAEAVARTYQVQDSHWNAYGNRIAASTILPPLESMIQVRDQATVP